MNIETMTMEEIEARLAQIPADVESAESEEKVAELSTEADALEARKAELTAEAEQRAIEQEAEQRAKEIKEIENGAGKEIRTFKENKEMEEMRTFAVDSVEYRNAWLKSLQGKALDEAEQRAFAASGSPVPTMISDVFFEKMKKLAPMLSEITLFNVAGNLKFYSEGVRDTASKHTENASITAGANDTMVSVQLGGFEFAKLVSISKAASAMSIDAFQTWLVNIVSGDLARAIDDYILNDETNGIAAITYTTGTNQILNTATTGYTYKDITDLIALLPAAYDAEAKFITNKATLYGQIANIKGTNGFPIFVSDPEVGLGRVLGFPVVVDDYVAKTNNAVYLGKWTDVVGNFSEAPNVERNDNSGFRTGSIDFRGFCVFDSKPAKTDGIVRLVSSI